MAVETLWEMMRSKIATVMHDVSATASHQFKETPGGIDVRKVGLSIWDGAYSLEFRGYPSIDETINQSTGVDVDVRINVAFFINQVQQIDDATETVVNDKREYTNAINDILAIIRAIQASQEFEQVIFKGTTPIDAQEDSEMLNVCGIDFQLSTRVTP